MSRGVRAVPLADLCESVDYGITTSASVEGNGPQLLRITDIVPPAIDWQRVPRCDIDDNRASRFALRKDDIVVARTGATVGYAKRVRDLPGPVVFASYLVRFRVDASHDIRYVGHVVESARFKEWVAREAGGAAQPNASASTLGRYPVPLPPLPEQRRIGRLLSAFDELIAINERRIELLEDLARSLYREWFVRFRFPGAMQGELVDSEVGRIPAAWPVESLGSVCSSIGAGNTPRRSDPTNWENGTVDWFTTGELRDGPLTTSTERVAWKPSLRLFEPPTILMAIYGSPTVGRLGWVTHTCSCNQAALALRTNQVPEAQEWLWHLLMSLRPRFNGMAQGAAQQNISKDKVTNTFVAVPPPGIIARFAERAGPLRALSHELHAENARLAATRDLLLLRLVTGRLDISDVDLGDLLPQEPPP